MRLGIDFNPNLNTLKIMKKALKIVAWSLAGIVGLLILLVLVLKVISLVNHMNPNSRHNRLDRGAAATRTAPTYDTIKVADFPAITYACPSSDPGIARVRDYFKVDEIAGTGDEITRMKNIMTWVHKNVKYDGHEGYSGERNAIALYEHGRQTGKGINCYMVGALANEIYLAAGFASQFVMCMPADSTDIDCHIINSVWSRDKQKWIWMDSAFGTWVEDSGGEPMSIPEVREAIIRRSPMTLSEGETTMLGTNRSYYLDRYMAKNLYWIGLYAEYRFNTGSAQPRIPGLALTPSGFRAWSSRGRSYDHTTHNPEQFWQAPE